MPLTYPGIFLGTGPDIDPVEGNTLAEDAALLLGNTYGGPGNALVNNIVTITSVNIGGAATALDQNNNTVNDQVRVDAGSGPVTYIFDSAAQYGATITYIDGSTVNVVAVVLQTTTGELFLVPSPTAGTPLNAALAAGPIRSVTLNTVVGANFLGLAVDRASFSFPTCFTRGTLIDTPQGPRPVEALRPGDLVLTRDRGAQPVRWVGGGRFDAAALAADPRLRPIRIPAGALGPGIPARDLVVSPQHRVLVASRIAARMAGAAEVLVPARSLAGTAGIAVEPPDRGVEYWHLLFDRHEVVLSEGAPTEALLLRPMSAAALAPAARRAIRARFPERLARADDAPARPVLRGRAARGLARRHSKHALAFLA